MAKPVKKTASSKTAAKKRIATRTVSSVRRSVSSPMRGQNEVRRPLPLPDSVDEATITRLVAEAEKGIPAAKLRRRGRPAIGDDAAGTYSVRLPGDLATLVDERAEIDGVTRGEMIRRALIEYLTK